MFAHVCCYFFCHTSLFYLWCSIPAHTFKAALIWVTSAHFLTFSYFINVFSPLSVFICWTAMRRTVSLSNLRDMALQVGTRDASSSIKLFILSRRRFSIWLWASLRGERRWQIIRYPSFSILSNVWIHLHNTKNSALKWWRKCFLCC